MRYWLDLFTGETWGEFMQHGSKISGFRASQVNRGKQIKSGDVLLCYLTGVQRWVGALEVVGDSSSKEQIWKSDPFPVRFEVRPLILLLPEFGVPMALLEGKVSFFSLPQHKGGYRGFLRRSPNPFSEKDAAVVVQLLREAESNPKKRPVDPKQLAMPARYGKKGKRAKQRPKVKVVTIPPDEAAAEQSPELEEKEARLHTELQGTLATVGAELGLHIWIARNDRSRRWNGKALGELPMVIDDLPTQFNDATTKTIELIDVLWLKGNSILAAFEIECTTSVHSGILRMSDLLALQPNLEIKLYLVAPDDRRAKVKGEILRPTFTLRDKPIPKVCGYLAVSKLKEKVSQLRQLGVVGRLNPAFIDDLAEYF